MGECDYLVKTPDRKLKTQLCHVNMLKPYCNRNQTNLPEVKPVGALNVAFDDDAVDPTIVVDCADVPKEILQCRLPNSG